MPSPRKPRCRTEDHTWKESTVQYVILDGPLRGRELTEEYKDFDSFPWLENNGKYEESPAVHPGRGGPKPAWFRIVRHQYTRFEFHYEGSPSIYIFSTQDLHGKSLFDVLKMAVEPEIPQGWYSFSGYKYELGRSYTVRLEDGRGPYKGVFINMQIDFFKYRGQLFATDLIDLIRITRGPDGPPPQRRTNEFIQSNVQNAPRESYRDPTCERPRRRTGSGGV